MIIDDFKEILDNFLNETKKPFKSNNFASKMRNEFTQDFKEFFSNIVDDSENYVLKLSPGMLNWTSRPWAGLRNIDSTNTFQEGLYLIYIFDFENNGFHLSLDQGSDSPKKDVRIDISKKLFDVIKSNQLIVPDGFFGDENKLYNDTVISKFYDIDTVNLNELSNDLKHLIDIYEFLIPYYKEYFSDDEDELSPEDRIGKYLIENNLGNYEKENYEEMFSSFKNKFSPEKLNQWQGREILYKIFLHDGDKTTLCYNLEFSKEYNMAGSISGGSVFKYSLFKYSKTNQWTVGSSIKNLKTLNESEAIEIATDIRDAIVNGANLIENYTLNTIEDYENLEIELNNYFADCPVNPTHAWIHKYYSLIFPDKFPIVHVNNTKKNFLLKFNINPKDGYYANDGQFKELVNKSNIKFYSLFDEKILNLFTNGENEFLDNHSEEGIGDENVQTINYWLISPGAGANLWDEFYNEGIIAIGMTGVGDLSKYQNKNQIKISFQEYFNDDSSHMHDVHASWQFVHDMKIGDVIFAKKGMGEIIGMGIVESGYEYDVTKSFHNIRKVKWTHKGNWTYENGKLPMKTLTDITNYKDMVNNIKENIVGEEIIEESVINYPIYAPQNFLDEVYMDEFDYNTLVDLLGNKKNIIVQGAPGVGKTFMAKRLAYSMMGMKDVDRVMMVQFHQSYSYEDFVMGYRPSKEGFELRKGSFYEFCKKAEEDSENDYFFIIDEINRGNLSKIFGELFMLIENDKRGEKNKIQLLYADESFFIPKNVYIIGLMNTADRSLAMIDYALRRRFAFFDLKPGFDSDGFITYQNELDSENFNNLVEVMGELNREIKDDESLGEGFRIGHSYLCNIKPEEIDDKLTYIVEYELIPLLKECWFDEPDKVNHWADRLRSVIDDS